MALAFRILMCSASRTFNILTHLRLPVRKGWALQAGTSGAEGRRMSRSQFLLCSKLLLRFWSRGERVPLRCMPAPNNECNVYMLQFHLNSCQASVETPTSGECSWK